MRRLVRQSFQLWERMVPFFEICFSKDGLGSPAGRQLIFGKGRRIILSACPPVARYLRRVYKMEGGCVSCGASCNLLFRCPQWNPETRLCSVYDDRPSICRLFPITPRDIEDRNLVLQGKACGYQFKYAKVKSGTRVSIRTETQT